MLILSRLLGQQIIINDNIIIKIISTNGMYVKIGVEAPRDISVHREEVWNKIKADEAKK